MISSLTGQPGVHWFTRFVGKKKEKEGNRVKFSKRTVSEEDVSRVITASSLFFFHSLAPEYYIFLLGNGSRCKE